MTESEKLKEMDRLVANAKAAMRAPVPARPAGDLEYPRRKRTPRQRVQSQREVVEMVGEEPILCVGCGGEVFLLGRLGNRLHVRCRYCGLDQSMEVR